MGTEQTVDKVQNSCGSEETALVDMEAPFYS